MKKENKPGVIVIEGHVQGLANTRALGRAGIPVIVVDKDNCIARYSKYCKEFLKCPDYRTDDFARFLSSLAQQKGLKDWMLLPSNDHAVYTISKFRDQLIKHFKVITPGLDIIDNIYKKHRLLAIAKSIGLPIPETWYPNNKLDIDAMNFKFPVMVKGKEGLTFFKTTGKKVYLAKNNGDLNDVFDQLPTSIALSDTFIQEIIPTDERNRTISYTAFSIEGEIQSFWTGIKLREHPAKFGTATFAQSIENITVTDLSKRLLKELKYTGVCEVEYLLDHRTGEYKLIEINARTWLWVGLAIACGVNYPVMIYNYLNGIENKYPVNYMSGVQWINWFTDSFHAWKSILGGKLSLKKYLVTLRGKKVNAIYDRQDILPSVMFYVLLPYLALKR